MKQKKNIILFLCMLCIFALTGCMKYVFNNSLYTSNSDVENNNAEYSVRYFETFSQSEMFQNEVETSNFEKKSCIRYEQLSEVQQSVYNEIFEGIQNYVDSINISCSINENDLEKIYDAIINTASFELVYPTRKYDYKYDSITGNVLKINPKYEISFENRQNMIEQVDNIANDIIKNTEGLDAFQTVKFFHDYLILNCSYDDTGDNYSNAYGVLVERKAVCEGYSRAFKYLCDKVDIPCELVNGNTDISHMWNIVKINGNWYHIDVTWDDPKNKDGDYISYTYFNLSEEQILIDHSINDTYIIPSANSTDMNFFNYYNLCVSSLDELKTVLYQQVYNACLNQNKYIYFKTIDKTTYDNIMSNLCNDYDVFKVIKEASNDANVSLNMSDISFSYDDNFHTFTITLQYT